mgnify:CR=1 FL=1
MLIFYGSYNTVIDSFRPKGTECSNCGARNQIVSEKSAVVFHFMYVPIFPVQVTRIYVCVACNNEIDIVQNDEESIALARQLKSRKWLPLWMFSGPIMALVGFGVFSYFQKSKGEEMLQRMQNNQNQIVEYETEEGSFTTMIIRKIKDDTVWLNYNNYQIDDYEYIGRITKSKNYNTDTARVSLKYLMEFFEDGKVKAVYAE